jgi:hypothetical protein
MIPETGEVFQAGDEVEFRHWNVERAARGIVLRCLGTGCCLDVIVEGSPRTYCCICQSNYYIKKLTALDKLAEIV